MNRQIILDTETTGLEPEEGHRVIEIACIELLDGKLTGREYQQYFNPDKAIDPAASELHGITDAFLSDKPSFAEAGKAFVNFIEGAELVIHHASFDVGFINNELRLCFPDEAMLDERCTIVDTYLMAKVKHPGQKNGLAALAERYGIAVDDASLHSALADARLLAAIYMTMITNTK